MALLSGESANVAEDCTDDLIVRRAIILLKEIFGSKNVARTKLRTYAISRWKANPYVLVRYVFFFEKIKVFKNNKNIFNKKSKFRKTLFKGAYSYMAVGASGNDYDVLASPVENKVKMTILEFKNKLINKSGKC